MDAVTLTNAKQHLEQIMQQVIINAEPMIVCADDGQRIVLLSLDEFNAWRETLYLLSNSANVEHLQQSLTEAHTGKIITPELIEV